MKKAVVFRPLFVAEIGGSPTPVGLADTVPAVLVVVDSRLSHAVLPASFSYDTCGYTHGGR
jgi:hypothetical protein